MNMKKNIMAVIGVAALLATVNLQAQSVTNSLNFLSQAEAWATSFNTNNCWTNATMQFDSGVATVTGVGLSDRINAQYDYGRFGGGIMGQFEGVGSTFGEVEATTAWAVMEKYDFKFEVDLNGGYDFNNDWTQVTVTKATKSSPLKTTLTRQSGAYVAEPGLGISKLLTPNTYATMKYLFPIESHGKFQPAGVVYVGVGCTF